MTEGREGAQITVCSDVSWNDAHDRPLLDPVYQKHQPGPGHPESPERLVALSAAFAAAGLDKRTSRACPSQCHRGRTRAVPHLRQYLDSVKHDFARGARDLSTGDTAIGPASLDVALHAVGGVLNAVDAVMSDRAQNAFCAVRPPGHHATPMRGDGLLHLQQHRDRGAIRSAQVPRQASFIADWDVTPRKRHAGYLLLRSERFLFQSAPMSVVSRYGSRAGDRRRKGATQR